MHLNFGLIKGLKLDWRREGGLADSAARLAHYQPSIAFLLLPDQAFLLIFVLSPQPQRHRYEKSIK